MEKRRLWNLIVGGFCFRNGSVVVVVVVVVVVIVLQDPDHH